VTAGSLWSAKEIQYDREREGRGPGRRRWRPGWNQDERCPPDPKETSAPGGAWRAVGLVDVSRKDQKLHNKRRKAIRCLRVAGYRARSRWSASYAPITRKGQVDLVYSDGPVEGLRRIDPWEVARRLSRCGARWGAQLRYRAADNQLLSLPLPMPCRQMHSCPVCAARRSNALARAVRAVLEADVGRNQHVALVTLTQRAHEGESLQDAIARWRDAWSRMTRGRPGRRWREMVAGSFYGIEVTRGAGANEFTQGPWWHVHAHVVVVLDHGIAHDRPSGFAASGRRLCGGARQDIGEAWRRASAAAAEAAGIPDHGWDPSLSNLRRDNETQSQAIERMAVGDWSGRWWRKLEDGDAVYQAAKYPTPIASMHPIPLAEYVAAAHGRRWHDATGVLRGAIRRAEELDDDDDDQAGGGDRVDLGIPLSGLAPGTFPALDRVMPRVGVDGDQAHRDAPDPDEIVWWKLSAAGFAAVDEVGAVDLTDYGGSIVYKPTFRSVLVDEAGKWVRRERVVNEPWIGMPACVAGDLTRRTLRELSRARGDARLHRPKDPVLSLAQSLARESSDRARAIPDRA